MPSHFTDTLTFKLPDGVSISDKNDQYPIIHINNAYASAKVAINGAHVIHYQPKGQEPVLWLSNTALFKNGKAIRGGIPLCWPWFGDHSNAQLPAHGFARNDSFDLINIESNEQGETVLLLRLTNNAFNQRFWADAFQLDAAITIGQKLTVTLTMYNNGNAKREFSSALHSYFTVSDVGDILIKGLDQTAYFDKVKGFEKSMQTGDIVIDQEVDRVYIPTDNTVSITDKGFKRTLHITKSGSQSTVVWNPWVDKAAAMKDFDDDGYKTMVCVETANAMADTISLAKGESHTISTTINVENHQ